MSGMYLEVYSQQLNKLEQLVNRFLLGEYTSARDIWKLEVDIIEYQVDVQDLISEERTRQQEIKSNIASVAASREENWREVIQELQTQLEQSETLVKIYTHVYHISRRFGDALAWTLLRNDEQFILPLTENQAVPSTSSGHGLQGMLSVAEALSKAGAGFPILHDMTSSLRVGDITFISHDAKPLTIEVKTQLMGREGNITTLGVAVYTADVERMRAINAAIPQEDVEAKEPSLGESSTHRGKLRIGKRLGRQLERMDHAKNLQAAALDSVTNLRGQDYLMIRMPLQSDSYHRDIVRDLLIRAKAEGYASQVVEDAFLYVATQLDPATTYPWSSGADHSFMEQVSADLKSSSIWCSESEKNSLWFGSTASYLIDDGRVPASAPSFFSYPFPPDIIIDMMQGHLIVIIFVNLGKVAEALEQIGLKAIVPKTEDQFNQRFLDVSTEIYGSDGSCVNMQLGGLYHYAVKIMYEFLSLRGFTDLVSKIAATAIDAYNRDINEL